MSNISTTELQDLMERFMRENPNGDSFELAEFMYNVGFDAGKHGKSAQPKTSEKKTYIVWRFILGVGMSSAEHEFVMAHSPEEAERMVDDPGSGYGILGSREWTKEDEDKEIKFDLW